MKKDLKILLLAPYYSATNPGESYSTYHWVKGISERFETVTLTLQKKGWDPSLSPTESTKVISWDDMELPRKVQRLAWELKPGYLKFYHHARRWIKSQIKQGWDFDLVHQINPLAMRYPCPAAGLGIDFIVGPLAGSLETPKGFRSESVDDQWFRKLRNIDRTRLRYDPWLRRTFEQSSLNLGVAPYVEELLGPKSSRFEIMSEIGLEQTHLHKTAKAHPKEPLKLLFVGRIIRTKGVIDAIRAVARLKQPKNVTFDIIGDGDLKKACEQESLKLGLENIVNFHGRIPRNEVENWYRKSDVFLFPSFREPSGNVVVEALSNGLPVITCDNGGPGYVINESCGLLVTPNSPETFPRMLAEAIETLVQSPEKMEALSENALRRAHELFPWPNKIDRLAAFYSQITQDRGPRECNI